jgi:hypothetical protein
MLGWCMLSFGSSLPPWRQYTTSSGTGPTVTLCAPVSKWVCVCEGGGGLDCQHDRDLATGCRV